MNLEFGHISVFTQIFSTAVELISPYISPVPYSYGLFLYIGVQRCFFNSS